HPHPGHRRPVGARTCGRGPPVSPPAEMVTEAIAALRHGEVIVLPTDTVYGLAAGADTAAGRDALYRLKGRNDRQPSALLAVSLKALLDRIPELGRGA